MKYIPLPVGVYPEVLCKDGVTYHVASYPGIGLQLFEFPDGDWSLRQLVFSDAALNDKGEPRLTVNPADGHVLLAYQRGAEIVALDVTAQAVAPWTIRHVGNAPFAWDKADLYVQEADHGGFVVMAPYPAKPSRLARSEFRPTGISRIASGWPIFVDEDNATYWQTFGTLPRWAAGSVAAAVAQYTNGGVAIKAFGKQGVIAEGVYTNDPCIARQSDGRYVVTAWHNENGAKAMHLWADIDADDVEPILHTSDPGSVSNIGPTSPQPVTPEEPMPDSLEPQIRAARDRFDRPTSNQLAQLLNDVLWKSADKGWRLYHKEPGQAGGNVANGARVSHDFIVHTSGIGVDVFGDAGGASTVQWGPRALLGDERREERWIRPIEPQEEIGPVTEPQPVSEGSQVPPELLSLLDAIKVLAESNRASTDALAAQIQRLEDRLAKVEAKVGGTIPIPVLTDMHGEVSAGRLLGTLPVDLRAGPRRR